MPYYAAGGPASMLRAWKTRARSAQRFASVVRRLQTPARTRRALQAILKRLRRR